MAKTSKVIDIRHGRHLTVIHINDPKERNQYRIYNVHNGHRKQLVKYNDFISVMRFLTDFFRDGVDAMMQWEMLDWCKNRTIK